MVASSALYLACGLVGALAGGTVGTVRGVAVATWLGAVLWWWQLRVALRESGKVVVEDRSWRHQVGRHRKPWAARWAHWMR